MPTVIAAAAASSRGRQEELLVPLASRIIDGENVDLELSELEPWQALDLKRRLEAVGQAVPDTLVSRTSKASEPRNAKLVIAIGLVIGLAIVFALSYATAA